MSANIGTAIRSLREHRSLTLQELSDTTGLSLSYLSLIERNKRAPSLPNLDKIASVFDLPSSILIFISSDMDGLQGEQSKIAKQMMAIVKDLFDDNEKYPTLP